ncbi:Na+/H+ antiporter subunit E [Streptomyces sp. TRM68367]|uniref:Na+/H+ antiporter subunit E n=1 Tax=Streptomyces sp. TRM68367 TaxID=2758415 RepID=UPI00165C0416|nr:Na+/H+ antiporter subunit E [Streptomyces sp. TRM68367]MBC9726330.1 Na+/H+ antiporter subunit E [Streptomyces sp. TRM68367]
MTQLDSETPLGGRTRRPPGSAVRSFLRTAPVSALFWLALSAHFAPLLLTLGVLSVAVVCWLIRRAGLDHHGLTPAFVLRLPRYCLWLSGQVFLTACAVVRQVWSPRMALRPVVEPTPAADLPERSQVVYANSITLTPGTLSLDIRDDSIEVHSLRGADIDALGEGAMLSRVRRTEARR